MAGTNAAQLDPVKITSRSSSASSKHRPVTCSLRSNTLTFTNYLETTMADSRTSNILIGVTGSVATVKLFDLIEALKSTIKTGLDPIARFKVIQTQNSKHFMSKDRLLEQLKSNEDDQIVEILDDNDEWDQWKKMSDPVLHIELRKWAHVLVIAPLDANTMAKMANGICDNLLTCVIRAWDMSKPLIYCPAMNVHMYDHPITDRHLSQLESLGYERVDCVEKKLACGDVGMGGMAAVEEIAEIVGESLSAKWAK